MSHQRSSAMWMDSRIGVSVVCIVLAVGCAHRCQAAQPVPTKLCTVLDNASEYNGQAVVTAGLLVVGPEASFLYSPESPSSSHRVYIDPFKDDWEASSSIRRQLHRVLRQGDASVVV